MKECGVKSRIGFGLVWEMGDLQGVDRLVVNLGLSSSLGSRLVVNLRLRRSSSRLVVNLLNRILINFVFEKISVMNLPWREQEREQVGILAQEQGQACREREWAWEQVCKREWAWEQACRYGERA